MFDIGGGELILIVLAIIVLFGPKKIPEIAQMFGKGMQQVRRAQAQFTQQFNEIKSEINTSVEQENKIQIKKPAQRVVERDSEMDSDVKDRNEIN